MNDTWSSEAVLPTQYALTWTSNYQLLSTILFDTTESLITCTYMNIQLNVPVEESEADLELKLKCLVD